MSEELNSNVKEMRQLYSMFHQEYTIMAEYRMLQTENLQGIYVIPSYENSLIWFGVIFVRTGHYEGGVFRFTLALPDKFPDDDLPVVTFVSNLYHPAVEPNTGILHLNEVFPQWDRKRNHVWQLLKYIYWIFHNLNIKVPANVEASVVYKTNRKAFIDKVKECVASSIDHIYDDPPIDDKHYITFKPYDPEVHDTAKNVMLRPPKPNEGLSQGISWVQPGSYQPFSKEETT
ncbi:protein crossbronx homolog [Achroia grisella]|uniref:protein crossbronx homolog n=1 Tax=Achroia grisella TaxID=688607 RepID=UPI0027D2619C|nr:protein crossbronx homolog [Achroia grisella]XP_059048913.1 protein crossbronx homolog [Achroia grisella]XP_059049772.1 protein crossbronx homolog [Achroia grisella]